MFHCRVYKSSLRTRKANLILSYYQIGDELFYIVESLRIQHPGHVFHRSRLAFQCYKSSNKIEAKLIVFLIIFATIPIRLQRKKNTPFSEKGSQSNEAGLRRDSPCYNPDKEVTREYDPQIQPSGIQRRPT